jgi:hypothetical protein
MRLAVMKSASIARISNHTLTGHSLGIHLLSVRYTRIRKGHPKGTGTMKFWNQISYCALAVREFVAPTYRPERHYMRGPGPACARRDRGTFNIPLSQH